MKEAVTLFRGLYKQHHDVEIGIAELKRKGFNEAETIEVLMEVLSINVIKANELVLNSLCWNS